jgi:CO/xanthine dehydrogenase FAD-binding subunit
MISYDYHQPQSLKEAFQLKNSIPESLYVAGGTDLMVRIKSRETHPPALISLRSIQNLVGVKNGNLIRVGAMTILSDVIKDPILNENFPILIESAKSLGSVQIRNAATIGGNLCNGSPAADMAPPLLVLGAKIRIQKGEKNRDILIEEFFKGPGETSLDCDEIVTEILLPPPEKDTKTIFLKKGRIKMDLAIASVAASLKIEGNACCAARIAAGSVAPVPMRLFQLESLLSGATISPQLLSEARQLAFKSVFPITDLRATEEHRRHMVGILVKRALEKLAGWNSG